MLPTPVVTWLTVINESFVYETVHIEYEKGRHQVSNNVWNILKPVTSS